MVLLIFFFNDTATTEIYTLSLHDALPISPSSRVSSSCRRSSRRTGTPKGPSGGRSTCSIRWRSSGICRRRRRSRSEEHTSELQSRQYLVCRLLLEKKNQHHIAPPSPQTSQ